MHRAVTDGTTRATLDRVRWLLPVAGVLVGVLVYGPALDILA